MEKSPHRLLLPISNHSFLLEFLKSTGLRDSAVTGLAEIDLHPELIWQAVSYTPDSIHKISGSVRRWYRTMTQYMPIVKKEVAEVRGKDGK